MRALAHRAGLVTHKLISVGKTALWPLFQEIRHPVKRVFPVLGLIAIFFLAIQTVGIRAGSARSLWPFVGFVIAALTIGAFLWNTPRQRYTSIFAKTFGWLPVTLGASSYYYWYWYANGSGQPSDTFFHAAADVLPVLLLAAVVDVRRSERLESKQLILPIIAFFLGEIAALNALAFGNAGSEDFAAVASSLVSSVFALLLAVMADLPEVPDSSKEEAATKSRTSMADHRGL